MWSQESVTDEMGLEKGVLIGIDLERGRPIKEGNFWREWPEVSLQEDV
jgi:hypothetical protein